MADIGKYICDLHQNISMNINVYVNYDIWVCNIYELNKNECFFTHQITTNWEQISTLILIIKSLM